MFHVVKKTPASTPEHYNVYVHVVKGTPFLCQGKRTVDSEGHESINDMYTENSMLQTENDRLRQRIKALSEAIEALKADNAQLMAEAAAYSLMGQNGKAVPRAIKGSHSQAWGRSEYSFLCFACYQGFCLFNFTYFSPQSASHIKCLKF